MIRLKRAYEPAARHDGTRYLVERLWPRGIRKEVLRLEGWCADAMDDEPPRLEHGPLTRIAYPLWRR